MYDLVSDPFEQENIIDLSKYQAEIKDLKNKLTEWMWEQGDKGVATELAVCERKGFPHRGCP